MISTHTANVVWVDNLIDNVCRIGWTDEVRNALVQPATARAELGECLAQHRSWNPYAVHPSPPLTRLGRSARTVFATIPACSSDWFSGVTSLSSSRYKAIRWR